MTSCAREPVCLRLVTPHRFEPPLGELHMPSFGAR
jgi:hypothetical protein